MDSMVSLKGSYVVKPAEETPNGVMGLSDFDLIAPITLEPTIYFYQNASSLDLESATNILKDSLSKALVAFYPLAGRLYSTGGGRFELHCNSLGAQILVAESQGKIDDFGDFSLTPQIRALIPSIDFNTPMHEQPLLLVQITGLSCGGISPPPLLIGSSDSLEERNKETTVTVLKLSQDQIRKLKEKANESRTSDQSSHPYTTFETVGGHMWRCASRARNHMSEQRTTFNMVVDARNRIEPPMPPHYFGNVIIRVAAETTSGELLSKTLSYATSRIREAIKKVTNEYVRSSILFMRREEDVSKYRVSHSLGCSQSNFLGNPNMGIASWTRLPLYGVDFGWGKEIYMGPGAIGYDGKAFILPGRDEDGSVTIPFRLQVAHMEAFKKFFYEEI